MSFPFRYLGHGTAKVSENFCFWLRFRREVTQSDQQAIDASMPGPLRDWIVDSDSSRLEWDTHGLAGDSGAGFKYAVKDYDPDHLEWIDDGLGALTDADVQRVIAEVMDDEGKGPRAPKAGDWDLFDAEFDLWLGAVHSRCPLELVVKDVRILKNHDSKWHRWSVEACGEAMMDLVEGLGIRSSPHSRLIEPMVRYQLLAQPAKSLSDAQRLQMMEALAVLGYVDGAALTSLVVAYPAKERMGLILGLIEARHPTVLSVFLTPKGKHLLLEDPIFEAAQGIVDGYEVPAFHWFWEIKTRLKLEASSGGASPTISETEREWFRRLMVLASKSGSIEREPRDFEALVSWAGFFGIQWS